MSLLSVRELRGRAFRSDWFRLSPHGAPTTVPGTRRWSPRYLVFERVRGHSLPFSAHLWTLQVCHPPSGMFSGLFCRFSPDALTALPRSCHPPGKKGNTSLPEFSQRLCTPGLERRGNTETCLFSLWVLVSPTASCSFISDQLHVFIFVEGSGAGWKPTLDLGP